MLAQELSPIAGRLKALRERAGMSQQALAVSAGLSVSVVSQIECGRRFDPRLSTLTALSSALGVSLDELTGQAESLPRGKGPKPRGRARR